jgi:hypothetical protein
MGYHLKLPLVNKKTNYGSYALSSSMLWAEHNVPVFGKIESAEYLIRKRSCGEDVILLNPLDGELS